MIADIAAVFHWPLTELEAMDLDELVTWRDLAVERFTTMNGNHKKHS